MAGKKSIGMLMGLFTLAVLLILGCSGGGGSGGSDDDDGSEEANFNGYLNAEYRGIEYWSDPETNLVSANFDGAGAIEYEHLAASDDDLETGQLTYTLNSDGVLTIRGGDTVLRGQISRNADLITFVNTDLQDGIGIGFYLKKKDGEYTTADILGEYIGVEYWTDPETNRVRIVSDGAGNMTFQDIASSDGDLDDGTLEYTIDADGAVTVTSGGVVASRGFVSPGGDVLVLADTNPTGGLGISVFVKVDDSEDFSNRDFTGSYYGFQYYSDPEATYMMNQADGAGTLTFSDQATSDDDPGSGSVQFAIESDGTISISEQGEIVSQGVLNPFNDLVILADTAETDDDIGVVFMLPELSLN